MTYSIIVTILLIIFIVLLIISVMNSAKASEVSDTRIRDLSTKLNRTEGSAKYYEKLAEEFKRDLSYTAGNNNKLRLTVEGLDGRIARQRSAMKHLRMKNEDLTDSILMVSDLIHVKFTARLPSGNLEKTLFKLGLGPCGLHVKSLKWTEQEDRYLIDQLCTNGERKQFTYYKSDVVGRIEFRHGQV